MISDDQIVRYVEVEVRRTLPYWRSFQDMRIEHRHRPVIEDLSIQLESRKPCSAFPNVDVVWAVSTVSLRVQTGSAAVKRKRQHSVREEYDSPDARDKRSVPRFEERKSWRGVPYKEFKLQYGTMHFVHHDAHQAHSSGADRSFHIQSVHFYQNPEVLQCAAGIMVHFALMVYAGARLIKDLNASGETLPKMRKRFGSNRSICTAKLRSWLPSSRVLVLGMGGNSISVALRRILGKDIRLDVVEMEAAVIETCRQTGTLMEDDPNHHIYNSTAEEFLKSTVKTFKEDLHCPGSPEGLYDLVFMDLFEPLEAKMEQGDSLVHQCASLLKEGALLVINDHQLPSTEQLAPYIDMFGDGLVHAINLHGWNESMIVGIKQSTGLQPVVDVDSSLKCSLQTSHALFDMWEATLSGVAPNPSTWLRSTKTHGKIPCRCRIWVS